jgi:hypothetical protein
LPKGVNVLFVYPQFFVYEMRKILEDFDLYVKSRSDWSPVYKKIHTYSVNYKKLVVHLQSSGQYSKFLDSIIEFPTGNSPDYYLVPSAIKLPSECNVLEYSEVLENFVSSLPHFKGNEKKHIFFTVGDNFAQLQSLSNSIVFQSSAHKDNPVKCLHYSSPIDQNFSQTNICDCKYDVSFQGCGNLHPVRDRILRHIPKLELRFKCFVHSTPHYFEELPENDKIELQKKWAITMDSSRFILCPRGRGLNTIRTFESLSFGRIPIVYADDTQLPLESHIDYSKIMVRIPESDVENTSYYLEQFLSQNDLEESSNYAKIVWKRYFSNEGFFSFICKSLLG